MARLEKRGHAHVADLYLAILHGIDHVGAGVHHFEAHIDTVLLEQALLHANEHWQVTEIVADHHVDRHHCLRRRRRGGAGRPCQCGTRDNAGNSRAFSTHRFRSLIIPSIERTAAKGAAFEPILQMTPELA